MVLTILKLTGNISAVLEDCSIVPKHHVKTFGCCVYAEHYRCGIDTATNDNCSTALQCTKVAHPIHINTVFFL